MSVVGTPEESIDDPFVQDSASTSVTLLVEEEPKAVRSHSLAVSMLDLREDLLPSRTDEPPTMDRVSMNDITISDAQVLAEEDTFIPSTTPTSATSHTAMGPPSPTDAHPTLLTELGATKHRYDTLQRALHDCSLALKELKRTLASSSPSPHAQTQLRQHLETALVRIDDYTEDARVELEIRVADEELTVRGLEMLLGVPGVLVDVDERAKVEASASAFVDGTDEGVMRALERFGRKLEDVQHDVAVVKRVMHGLVMEEGERGERGESGECVDENKDAGWTRWTAGLLGANTTPSRSPTPVQTFGAVMISPPLRHAMSHEGAPDQGPLAGPNLRIPMPPRSPSSWTQTGLGRAMEETRPGTLSAMYAVGGLRSASVGFGVGLASNEASKTPTVTAGTATYDEDATAALCWIYAEPIKYNSSNGTAPEFFTIHPGFLDEISRYRQEFQA
ncbi:hypothetical protein HD554DRAFT_2165699 [Boletus coccyginus]|nr:hypothetical protein HD554DRAFT_2165699 [Boletus coccyginus]